MPNPNKLSIATENTSDQFTEQTGIELDPVAPKDESKADKFHRLATFRLGKVVERIRQMHNLSSFNYEYTPEQAAAIIKIIDGETEALEKALLGVNDPAAIPEIPR